MNIQEACLNRYPSPQSRRRIGYELNRLAQLFQIASVNDIDWPKFTRATIGAVLARPELISRKAASQNFTLSVIKSLCEEACFQQLMPLEQYFAIERIPNFRGNSQHGSPCLSSDDIRQLLQGCIKGGTPKDIRMPPSSLLVLAADYAEAKSQDCSYLTLILTAISFRSSAKATNSVISVLTQMSSFI